MDTTITVKYTKSGGGGGGGITIPSVKPTYSDAISDLPEPIEPQDVGEPDDTTNASDATGNTAETQASHPGQTLVSTQTITHEYLTLSGKVVRETVKTNNSITYVQDFLYDESGRPFALNYSTDGGSSFITYYYILNLQGDVVKLVTSSGSAVATYEYDAWGNILSKSGTMADKNPLHYRGYYYDTETGFYYLQSRYYDPTVRRFINADSYASTGKGFIGSNMFAYCRNNPVCRIDASGCMDISIVDTIEALREWLLQLSGDIPPAAVLLLVVVGVQLLAEASNTMEEKTAEAIQEVKAYVDAADVKEYKRNSVYVLRDSDNIVRYVGRTNDPNRRRREHGRDPLKKDYHMQVIATGMSRTHAIMFEQTLISAYSLDNLDNARREIALKNIPKFITYLTSFRDIVCGIPEDIIRNILERR